MVNTIDLIMNVVSTLVTFGIAYMMGRASGRREPTGTFELIDSFGSTTITTTFKGPPSGFQDVASSHKAIVEQARKSSRA